MAVEKFKGESNISSFWVDDRDSELKGHIKSNW